MSCNVNHGVLIFGMNVILSNPLQQNFFTSEKSWDTPFTVGKPIQCKISRWVIAHNSAIRRGKRYRLAMRLNWASYMSWIVRRVNSVLFIAKFTGVTPRDFAVDVLYCESSILCDLVGAKVSQMDPSLATENYIERKFIGATINVTRRFGAIEWWEYGHNLRVLLLRKKIVICVRASHPNGLIKTAQEQKQAFKSRIFIGRHPAAWCHDQSTRCCFRTRLQCSVVFFFLCSPVLKRHDLASTPRGTENPRGRNRQFRQIPVLCMM